MVEGGDLVRSDSGTVVLSDAEATMTLSDGTEVEIEGGVFTVGDDATVFTEPSVVLTVED